MRHVDLFHIGPQKSGTTWIFRCLEQHPEIACPPSDSIHYFDIHFARGREWYASHFRRAPADRRLFDPTPTYVRSTAAPRRVRLENPDARIALTLRDPIERAFSHYWHEKKKGRIDYSFGEVLGNYDLFASWVEPGFYAEHVERWLECFPREQILVQRFEDIASRPGEFLDTLCAHFAVATGHRPDGMSRKVNAAGPRAGALNHALNRVDRVLQRVGLQGGAVVSGRREYDRGVDAETRARLVEICSPEVARLESLLDIDLSTWPSTGRENPEVVAR